MTEYYRIFDTALSCEFPLPELKLLTDENGFRIRSGKTGTVSPGSTRGPFALWGRSEDQDGFRVKPGMTGEDCALYVRMGQGDPDQFASQGFEQAFEWCDYAGNVVCWCERRLGDHGGDEYLYIFTRSATFHISSEGLISCFLHPGSSMQMLRHLLLNQIIPRYLATSGRLVLHAAAVTLANGKSVAFLGNSGFGKSTLVSSFHRHGAKLINDDCIMLGYRENGVYAIGGLVGIRLFPDSVNAVFDEAAGFTNYTPYTDKQQLFLKNEAGGEPPQPCVLDAMFLLNDPREEPADTVSIEPVSGSQAMMAMIYSAFSLDPSDKKMIVNNFNNAGQAISDRLGIYSLQYPRDHERLAEVRAAVIAQVESPGG